MSKNGVKHEIQTHIPGNTTEATRSLQAA